MQRHGISRLPEVEGDKAKKQKFATYPIGYFHIESEAELFAGAEQVDLAEKDFHDALAHRNEAQIAYLREPSNLTHVGA